MSTSQKGSHHIKHTLQIHSSSYRPSKGLTPCYWCSSGKQAGRVSAWRDSTKHCRTNKSSYKFVTLCWVEFAVSLGCMTSSAFIRTAQEAPPPFLTRWGLSWVEGSICLSYQGFWHQSGVFWSWIKNQCPRSYFTFTTFWLSCFSSTYFKIPK